SGSTALAQACANLLVATNHVGRPNNGLLGVWQRPNDQGAWDIGFRPVDDLKAAMQAAKALYVVAADPAGDDPSLAEATDFLVVQELFLTGTAKLADVVLPVEAFSEREGTFTNGERRVQRFYPAVPSLSDLPGDFSVTSQIGQRLGQDLEGKLASKVMLRIATQVPGYAGLSYQEISKVFPQLPIIGREDLYYGGTSYDNQQGLGVQLAPGVESGADVALSWAQPPALTMPADGLLAVPVTRLYDRGTTLLPSELLHQRIPQPYVALNPADAAAQKILNGSTVQISLQGGESLVQAHLDEGVPAGVVLVPRSLGMAISGPEPVKIRLAERVSV
ncbi:MAG TPA: molybdopterin-dependent oxidoreductase, partial [Anaerolineales bacterium]